MMTPTIGARIGEPRRAQQPIEDPSIRALKDMQMRIAQQQEESGRNTLMAENMALEQSRGLQGTNAPRQITDKSMVIGGTPQGNGGAGGVGGGKTLPPHIEGRYMDLTSGGAGAPQAPNVPRAAMGAASFSPGDAQAYQDAEFSRAKDRSGQIGRSAMQSLRGELAGRGILGSGTEMRGTADRLAETLQPLADLNVAHLREDYDASQLERTRAETARLAQFSGDISQRGQDLSSQGAFEALKAQMAREKQQQYHELVLRGLVY